MSDVPIRVFIGMEPKQRLACEVLKFSIDRRCGVAVEFTEIGDVDEPLPQQTGFSFARWQVPQLVGYAGRAIYLDADIVVIGSIEALWAEEIPEDRAVLARPTPDDRYFTSVMVMDCGKLKHWDFARLHEYVQHGSFQGVMWASKTSPYRKDFAPLAKAWNTLDRRDLETRAVHYTDLRRQPWRYAGHPAAATFQDELREALAAGSIAPELVKAEIAKGHVRADLLTTA